MPNSSVAAWWPRLFEWGLRYALVIISIFCILGGVFLALQFFYSDRLLVVKENNQAVEWLGESLQKKMKGEGEEEKDFSFVGSLLHFYSRATSFFQGTEGESETEEVSRDEQIQQLPQKGSQSKEAEELSALISSEPASKAHQNLLSAIGKDSFNSKLYLNLGLAFELKDELKQAFRAYEQAQRHSKGNPLIDFLSLYNAARIRGLQKDIPEALRLYQGALALVPGSIEIKTNIELLLKEGEGQGSGGQPEDSEGEGQGEKDSDGSESEEEKRKKDGPIQNGREQARVFESGELSKDDVQNILDEIQRQEEKIRAKESKSAKEKPRAKDW